MVIEIANNTELTLISAYNPPNRAIDKNDLNALLNKDQQILLSGDLNAKSTH